MPAETRQFRLRSMLAGSEKLETVCILAEQHAMFAAMAGVPGFSGDYLYDTHVRLTEEEEKPIGDVAWKPILDYTIISKDLWTWNQHLRKCFAKENVRSTVCTNYNV